MGKVDLKDADQMKSTLTPTLRFLIVLACLALAIPFLHGAAPLINSFLLALLIVMAVSPLLYWLRRQEYPNNYQEWARQVPNPWFIIDLEMCYMSKFSRGQNQVVLFSSWFCCWLNPRGVRM